VTFNGAATLDRRLANFRRSLRDAERGPRDGRVETGRARAARDFAERLATAIDGEVVRSRHGTFVRLENPPIRVPLDRARLAALPGQPPKAAPLICIDTETTGLGTAAGTYAFLVGVGTWDGDVFRQVQLVLPEQSDELGLLMELAARIPRDAWLVTYNGRGFDWPLLVTRFRMARRPPPTHDGHLDLLPLVRRMFRHRLLDARLPTVEAALLGVRRIADVEGWEIPGRYLEFLRGGPAAPLLDVTRHNHEDVLSLARLLAHVESRFGDPGAWRHADPGDLAGLAASFTREERHEEALACLDAALEGPQRQPARDMSWSTLLTMRADDPRPRVDNRIATFRPPAGRTNREWVIADRARLLRRLGRYDEALDAWRDLATGGGTFAIVAWIEVAKLLEHRRRDAAGALAATRAAQAAAERSRFVGRPMSRLETELGLRARRLTRRIHRARGTTPGPDGALTRSA
jgi:tetratricopeptide (TPR) repeat protein